MPFISDESGRMLEVRGGWVICPACGRGRVLPLHPRTRGEMIPFYCKRCRRGGFLSVSSFPELTPLPVEKRQIPRQNCRAFGAEAT